MKKILNLLLVLFPILVISQTVTQNYIKTTTYKVPTQTAISVPNITQANQNITYFDGLGRPIQQVAHQQSGTGKDIVTPVEYDAFGRQVKDYLPYVPTATASLDYKTTALTEVGTFYNTAKYENTTNPFSQKEFEASPLNRVLKQAAPGEDWKLGNGHEIRLDYQANTNADLVRRFGVSFIGGNTENPYLEDEGIYAPSQLYKTITKDENWQANQTNPDDYTTVEFKDKEEHVVLKRTFDAGKWHDTYYVYDDYGNLTYVLPPKVFTYYSITQGYEDQYFYSDSDFEDLHFFTDDQFVELSLSHNNDNSIYFYLVSSGFTPGSSLISGKIADLDFSPALPDMILGNIMVLDVNGNLVVGGVASIQNGSLYCTPTPGVGVYPDEYGYLYCEMTKSLSGLQALYTPLALDRTTLNDLIYQYRYDKRNRLIEKKLPGKEWEYIVYDKLNRPVLTQDANLKTFKKWIFTKYDVFNRPVYTGEYINTVKTTRADVQLLADAGTTLSETKQAVNTINGTTVYYSNNAFPNPTDINLLTINYYDNYDFDLNGGGSAISYTITPITNAKGLTTGNKVRVLGTSSWITSLTYYDTKSRAIYNYTKNDYLGTTSTVKNQFDFVGKTLETTSTHLRNGVTTSIVDAFTYDQAGRLTKQTQAINGTTTPEMIVANSYDELGQLSGKKVGGKTIQGLQKVDYAYNIRGWLKSINDPNNLNQDNDLFGFGLNYNTLVNPSLASYYQNKPLYNGNISSTSWKTNNVSSVLKQYHYTYDALNRFKTAIYAENNVVNNKFEEIISGYDRNGNIMYLTRNMPTPGVFVSGYMDILRYYYNEGNRLIKVMENANTAYGSEGFKDGNNTDDDYSYDANGNMILDKNKGITAIAYNHLNLPVKITFGNGTIDYFYDATGVKQRKIVSSGTTTDYASGFQYENNILKFFPQPEGFVEYNSGTFSYIYQYKDHLGNVRLSYSDSNNDGTIAGSEILEENNYYPFGLKHKNNNVVNSTHPALKYKYNGKELQDELGLHMYDYGARNYDPALGRWINIDPHIEKYESISPYSYVFNNPIKYIDIKGKDPGDVVVVFGGGDILKNNDKGGALAIQRNLQSLYSNSKGGKVESFVSKYWGTSLSDSESLDDATQGAYDYILSNYNKDKGQDVEGGKIIIEGYSYGGVLASHLASRLRKNKINIDLLVTVDTAAGPESDDINRTVSSNVKKYINIFQTNPSAIGSHGAENKKEKKSNTNGVNVDLTKITNEHGKIDEVAFKAVIQQILKELNN
ncbi:DUF6443 domain-containing protein [Flavobacterium salmonis]|uniref:DUF6443 domain-containing protein n=1 Tax=Flavobacterium salmonis TaxID=2654844 RepID=A0A6V6Z0J9_9FLAO|nr:DUF6443 domain-containing protein [Flavobacterium salmonis]CAD0005099.1 hypothetical protein FLAT13_02580 [Flavobacterium salmonis]